MKKYLVLFLEFGLASIVLWCFVWNGWIPLFQKPLDLTSPLVEGDYIAVSRGQKTEEILVKGNTTTNVLTSSPHRLVFFSLSERAVVFTSEKVHLYPQKTIFVHSFLIGVVILLSVLFAYWLKKTKEFDWATRFFLFALVFGWSGSLSVLFLFLSVFVGLSNSVKSYHFRWYHALAGAFFLWALFSGLFSRFPVNGVGAAFLFLGYMLIDFSFRARSLEKLPLTLVGRAIFSAFLSSGLVSFFQQLFVGQGVGIWDGSVWLLLWPYHEHELVSLFEWSARGGYWIGLMVSFLFTLFLREKNTKEKILLATGLVIGLVTLLFTQSRGGFVLAFVGMFTQLLFLKRGYLALLFLVLPLTFVLFAPDSKWAQSIKNPLSFHTNVQRLHQIRAGLDFWKEANPLTGIGLMNFKEYYYEKRHEYDIYSVADYLHQGYLAILLETGVVGWVLLYGFFAVMWTKALSSALKKKGFGPACLGLQTGFLTSLLFDAMLLYAFYLGMWVWMWIGFSEVVAEEKEKGKQD